MSSYQVQFFNKLQDNIRNLEDKLTANENNSLTRSLVNTCYWAKALKQTFSDMENIGMMLAMNASCDFRLIIEREKMVAEAHNEELKNAVDIVAKRITEAT